MIVLRSPKGWTGPKVVDGLQIEGTFRAHQVPLLVDAEHPDHVEQLESWMKSYRPEELFDERRPAHAGAGRAGAEGRPADGRQSARQRRPAAARPAHAGLPRPRGGCARRPAPSTARTRSCWASSCATWSTLNQEQRNFRIFGPDETLSNLLGAVFEATNRQWDARTVDERRVPRARRARAGLDAQRAPVRGLAGGLPAHRPARAVQQLRGLHPHRRLDVQPARQVAEGHARSCRGGGRSPR